MTPRSFMSEHTVEYALVYQIVRILSPYYRKIIPIYLWMNREGNKRGISGLSNRHFSLSVIYPRRPKVHDAGHGPLYVKFNDLILTSAAAYQKNNIPVFAGVPLVADLDSFDLDAPCAWFELLGHEYSNGDSHLKLSLSGNLLEPLPGYSPVVGPIDEESIIKTVSTKSRLKSWEEWVEVIRDVKKASRPPYRGRFLLFGGAYKPFYLLLGAGL